MKKTIIALLLLLLYNGCAKKNNSTRNDISSTDSISHIIAQAKQMESNQNQDSIEYNDQYELTMYDIDSVQYNMIINDTTCLSIDSIRNSLIYDNESGWARLRDSKYSFFNKEEDIEMSIELTDKYYFVDVDGDGYKDAIGCLAVNAGGTGWFTSLAIFLNRNKTSHYSTSYSIGDREGIDSLFVRNNTLDVFFKVHGPNDGMCCPSVTMEKKFVFKSDTLIELK